MKVAGIPFAQGAHKAGVLKPTAVVLHRTFGSWRGDYAVGRLGRGGEPIGFHFLIGKEQNHWAQFYDTAVRCYHAKGANDWAVGIEFEGSNTDILTDWQVEAGRKIIEAVCSAHEIPVTYTVEGARRKINGCLPHALVPGSDHTDFIRVADWARMFSPTPPPFKPIAPFIEEDEMYMRRISDGAIIHVYGERWRHLDGPTWANRAYFGAKIDLEADDATVAAFTTGAKRLQDIT